MEVLRCDGIDGGYYSQAEYGYLYQLAPNIQRAFETADDTFAEARKQLKRKIEEEKRRAQEQKG